MAATLVLDIVANATKAVAGMRQIDTAAGNAGNAAQKSSSKFGTMAKAAGAMAGAAALGGVVAIFKTGIDEQKDFLAGQAQLANGIKTTHNAAHVSVGSLEDLASSVQNYSGQSDDSIVSSEKLLLTFTNIGNQTGKNNDIFDQATKATADMAAKMGGDASKYAVQLGKALNDPVKGISALTKVGVSFTSQQKATVKALVEGGDVNALNAQGFNVTGASLTQLAKQYGGSMPKAVASYTSEMTKAQRKQFEFLTAGGHTLQAQKLIMGELTKEFGGSAKAAGDTLPGQMERAKRSFEDVSQGLIASLMPILTELGDILIKDVMPAFKAVMGFVTDNKEVFGIVAGAILAIVAAIKIWTGVQTVFNLVMAANPILLIILAIIALGAALVIAYKKSATFRKIVQTAFRVVAAVAKTLWSAIKTAFMAIWNILVFVGKAWFTVFVKPYIIAFKILKAAITAAVSWIKSAFTALVDNIGRIFHAVIEAITAPFRAAWNWIKNTLIPALKTGWDAVVAVIKRVFHAVITAITAPFKTAWDWIKNTLIPALKSGWDAIVSTIRRVFSGVINAITTPFKTAWDWIKNNVITPLKNAFGNVVSGISSALKGVTNAITAPFKAAWDWISAHVFQPIGNFFSDLPSKIGGFVSDISHAVVNGIINALNSIMDLPWVIKIHIPIPLAPDVNFGPYTVLPKIPNWAGGAYVTGATLAMVGEGSSPEFVTPEPMLRRLIRDELGAGGIHITVNGALDPDAVARQIESLLTRRNRRVNGVTRRGAPTAVPA